MTINYNVQGPKRKELVQLIANFTGCSPKYKGAPSFAYEVDYFTIDKNGSVSFDDSADSEVIERLLEMLYDNSFVAESQETEEDSGEGYNFSVSVPKAQLTDRALGNLENLITAKGALIKKALATDKLPVIKHEDRYEFPWFAITADSDEVKAYSSFILALCKMATKQNRINSTEKDVENDKYAFRCFLLRLGFVGDEYKMTRKILLRNLTGSSAFKSGQPNNKEVG